MSIYERAFGNAYANDPDFDRMSGRVTYQHEIVGMTLDGWKVKHCVTYIDIGKPAPVEPSDPDAQEQPERLADYKGAKVRRAPMGQTLRRYKEMLTVHGPQTVNRLAEMTGTLPQSVRISIEYHRDVFIAVGEVMGGRGKMATVWGLAGVHDGEGA